MKDLVVKKSAGDQSPGGDKLKSNPAVLMGPQGVY